MRARPAPPKEAVITCLLVIVMLVVVLAVIIGLAMRESSHYFKSQPTSTPDVVTTKVDGPVSASATTWKRREIGGASLELPFALELEPIMSEKLRTYGDIIESASIWENVGDKNRIRIGIAKIVYRAGPVDLDGAAHGAMSSGLKPLYATIPKYVVEPVTISGLDGRKAEYQGKAGGREFRAEVVVVARGNTMWQIQALIFHPAAASVMERAASSLEILPP